MIEVYSAADDDYAYSSEPVDTSVQLLDLEGLFEDPQQAIEEGLPLSTQSTPCRRTNKSAETLPTSCIESSLWRNIQEPTTSRTITTTSIQQPRSRRRCNWGLWIFRILIVVTDVIVFLVFDDSASNALVDAIPPASVSSMTTQIPGSKLSHARTLEAPEFRILERLVFDESSHSNSTSGWVLSLVFLVGVCLEVLWKEVYQKRRRRWWSQSASFPASKFCCS